MNNNKIEQKDSLEFLKTLPNYSVDINYSDPPYGLGSKVIIRPDGKPDYDKANDFMNKWDMPTGVYWEQWFKESFRTLKHGGYVIMFGMDRQLLLFKYYASMSGLQERQSMYWYFISNFPKASDLSKNLDKNAGVEREIIGINPIKQGKKSEGVMAGNHGWAEGETNITAPSSQLAQKYDGYKYSISPLKQTNETIMIFQKPYKSGSCMHDTLRYENGDTDCCCGALNIDKGRVGTTEMDKYDLEKRQKSKGSGIDTLINLTGRDLDLKHGVTQSGRYPAQTFVDDACAEMLDRQSGIKTSKRVEGVTRQTRNVNTVFDNKNNGLKNGSTPVEGYSDVGGCSKILHKCDYEKDEHDLYFYCPKVSKRERNAGCEGIEDNHGGSMEANITSTMQLGSASLKGTPKQIQPTKNVHPTLKPIALNRRILELFKTPNPQTIIFPFAGAGSEIIGGIKAGFKEWNGCEINQDYIEIANARIKHHTQQKKINSF